MLMHLRKYPRDIDICIARARMHTHARMHSFAHSYARIRQIQVLNRSTSIPFFFSFFIYIYNCFIETTTLNSFQKVNGCLRACFSVLSRVAFRVACTYEWVCVLCIRAGRRERAHACN